MTDRSWSISSILEPGPDDELGDDVGRASRLARRDTDPVDGRLAVGRGVEAAADALDRLGDRPGRRERGRPLERDVFHEMGDAGLVGRLETRSGEDVGRDRDRARAGDPGADDPRSLRQGGSFEHRPDGTGRQPGIVSVDPSTGPQDDYASQADGPGDRSVEEAQACRERGGPSGPRDPSAGDVRRRTRADQAPHVDVGRGRGRGAVRGLRRRLVERCPERRRSQRRSERTGAPDPGYRGGQVQRRHGPHRPARRRRLEPGPLRGPAVRRAERARTRMSPTSRSCPRARTPSRSSAASLARASTSSSAPRSATWIRWRRSPRSSPTRPSCT